MPKEASGKENVSEDLAQAAAVLELIVQLDHRCQERLDEAEAQAQKLLDSVGAEIAQLERSREEQLEAQLAAYAAELNQSSENAVHDADLRSSKAHQELNEHYQRFREHWIESLINRTLKG